MTKPKTDDFVLTEEEIENTRDRATQPDWDKHPGATEEADVDPDVLEAQSNTQLRFIDGDD